MIATTEGQFLSNCLQGDFRLFEKVGGAWNQEPFWMGFPGVLNTFIDFPGLLRGLDAKWVGRVVVAVMGAGRSKVDDRRVSGKLVFSIHSKFLPETTLCFGPIGQAI